MHREIHEKIDAEIEEIILSKWSDPVADLLFEQWRMNVQKNEDISHKRWSNNDKWLKSYESEFLKLMNIQIPFSWKETQVKATNQHLQM